MQSINLTLLLAATLASPAFAHAMLLQSSPTDGSMVPVPTVIDLTFSEEITADVGVAMKRSGTPVALGPITLAPNYSVVTVSPQKPMVPGKYMINWHNTARDDGHKANGSFSFTVESTTP